MTQALHLSLKMKNIHILCVENDDEDAFIFKMAIQKILPLAKITFIKDGEDFIFYVQRKHKYMNRNPVIAYHMIFLDVDMPKMSGIEVLKEIYKNKNAYTFLKSTPFFMLSGSKKEKDRQESLDFGAQDYLIKPFSYNEMVHSLNNSLSNHLSGRNLAETEI